MMRTFLLGARFLPILLVWSSISADDYASPETSACEITQTCAAGKYTEGLLWRIEKKQNPASYLFGTLHTDDPRVLALPPVVKQTFERSDNFITEMALDADVMSATVQSMFFTNGQTLPQVLGPKLYAETREALLEHGFPEQGIELQKPWVAMMILSMPRIKGVFLDLALQIEATRQGKPVYGLETAAEQLAVFNNFALADQIVLLEHTLNVRQYIQEQLEELTQAWLARDLTRLMAVMNQHKPTEQIYNVLMERLFTERDERMARRMQPRLENGNAFIAVGAGHLPGLLTRLEAQGYRVSRVY